MPAVSGKIVAGVVLAALVILTLSLWLKPQEVSPDPWPRETLWICQAGSCGAHFQVPIPALGDIYAHQPPPGSPIACPKCGDRQTTRASLCPHCDRFVPRSFEQRRGTGLTCPHCQKPVVEEIPPAN